MSGGTFANFYQSIFVQALITFISIYILSYIYTHSYQFIYSLIYTHIHINLYTLFYIYTFISIFWQFSKKNSATMSNTWVWHKINLILTNFGFKICHSLLPSRLIWRLQLYWVRRIFVYISRTFRLYTLSLECYMLK